MGMIMNANTVQSHWTLNVPGANLNCDHEIFTIKYIYLIFKELNSDLFEFEEIIRPGPDKTYNVDKMLPFTGWAHYHEVESCRGMEELWKHNIESVAFVLNCTKPSKSTIGSFLLEYEDVIKLFDDFIKKFGVNLGLIEGKTIYWDGTFLKANCNNHKKMYPTQILFLESFIKKHYGDYLNNESNIWEMLRNYYYNDHMYAEELQEILSQLKDNTNHHGIHLLKNAVLTDMNTNKIIKRLEHMKKNIP